MRTYKRLRQDSCVFFFFQAEDGIRDVAVTGVQTCALPISRDERRWPWHRPKPPGQSARKTGDRFFPEPKNLRRREQRWPRLRKENELRCDGRRGKPMGLRGS